MGTINGDGEMLRIIMFSFKGKNIYQMGTINGDCEMLGILESCGKEGTKMRHA